MYGWCGDRINSPRENEIALMEISGTYTGGGTYNGGGLGSTADDLMDKDSGFWRSRVGSVSWH